MIIPGAKERFRPVTLTWVTAFPSFIPPIPGGAMQVKLLASPAGLMGFRILIIAALLIPIVSALTATHIRKWIRAKVADMGQG